MNINDETDDDGDHGNGYAAPALDPFTAALVLIDLAQNPKATKAALKKLAQLDRDIGVAEQKLAAIEARAADTAAVLAEREAELAARAVELERREAAFESQAGDVRDELYAQHNRVEQAHRQLVHRIMSTAGIAGNWNFNLQDPPTWEQLRRMVAGLPDDLPAPAAEVVTREVTTDWTGSHSFIAGSTLTRSVPPS
jgi:hypothetical protein